MRSTLKNLLIVEDNSYIANSVANAAKDVSNIGNICVAVSLQEAISCINNSSFDLVILDLKLPDGNGVELLRMLKEKEIVSKVFVFSISKELKKTCLKYGAIDFFDKAQDFDKLVEAIKRA
ncbi:response regulator [Polaribacter sp.]|uniref:response regulator n=1 Tax=Polaribacter sp. TaxID=1920175 RepID=UPI003EF1B624